MKVHYPKLYNMAHLFTFNVFTDFKGSNNYVLIDTHEKLSRGGSNVHVGQISSQGVGNEYAISNTYAISAIKKYSRTAYALLNC